jgi:hypothetical protein
MKIWQQITLALGFALIITVFIGLILTTHIHRVEPCHLTCTYPPWAAGSAVCEAK